jgi:hypothetical protein
MVDRVLVQIHRLLQKTVDCGIQLVKGWLGNANLFEKKTRERERDKIDNGDYIASDDNIDTIGRVGERISIIWQRH